MLTSYWTKITASALLVLAAASLGGTILVTTNRSMLTAGVMIALALVPAATMSMMALLYGDMEMSFQALQRLGCDMSIVIVASMLVFGVKQKLVHKRKMVL